MASGVPVLGYLPAIPCNSIKLLSKTYSAAYISLIFYIIATTSSSDIKEGFKNAKSSVGSFAKKTYDKAKDAVLGWFSNRFGGNQGA